MHRRFSLIDEYESSWFELSHLTSHFRSDRTGSSGNHNDLIVKHLPDGIHIHFDLISRQQVFDIHVFEVLMEEVGLAIPLYFRGQHFDFHTFLDEPIHEFCLLAEMFALERADNQHSDMHICDSLKQLVVISKDTQSEEHLRRSLKMRIIIGSNKSSEVIHHRVLAADGLGETDASIFNTIDERTLAGG